MNKSMKLNAAAALVRLELRHSSQVASGRLPFDVYIRRYHDQGCLRCYPEMVGMEKMGTHQTQNSRR